MAQPQNFGKDSGRFQKSNCSQLYEFCRRGAANVWVSPHFGFIKDDFIPEGDCQAAFRFCIPSWPCSLGDRGAEARKRAEWAWCSWSTGDYKCDAGVSVKNVPAAVNIKTLNGRFVAHKFSTGWSVGVMKSVEKKESVAGQFAVKYTSGTYCWTKKLKKEDYGVDKYWVLLAVVKA